MPLIAAKTIPRMDLQLCADILCSFYAAAVAKIYDFIECLLSALEVIFFPKHNKFSTIKLAFILMWLLSPLKYTK